ncbi:MAG: S8 family serine peptidase [Methanobacterium sp.]|uniref:S8 family serine peptidase n=1 Tax=Methanobacterium sp. TaxID=2164 RepID=UPI003D64BDAF|nr:S8 family serine peptidase [Methanobacterium sp.]
MKKSFILVLLIFILVSISLSTVNAADDSNSNGGTTINYDQSLNSYSGCSTQTGSSSSVSADESSTSTNYSASELFIRFNSSTDNIDEISQNAHLQTGATVLKEYNEVKGLQLVKIPTSISLQDAVAIYKQNPYVIYAEPNYVYKNELIPNDPAYTANYLWGLPKINAPAAWDITTGSSNVIIAVVDTGINLLHPDLSGNLWVNTGEIPGNGIDDDHNGYIDDVYGWNFLANTNDVSDDNSHGTHVAGIIAAVSNNAQGVTGVIWNAKIMPLKFLDSTGHGYVEDAVSAISYATRMGAHIINCSWGGTGYSQALKDIIDASSALVVCAAGNNYGMDVDVSPMYPASYTSSNIIAVAATEQADNLASFSNYGLNSVDVAAPGLSIYSTIPGSYGYKSGTSMATPYVSGLAGLIKSLNPGLNSLQIKYTIMGNVDYIASLSGKTFTGGRINAVKALTNIITDTITPIASADLRGGSYYYSPVIVSLTASKAGHIYYTLDGTTPTTSSYVYTSPIAFYTSKILKFRAMDTPGMFSPVYAESYFIYGLVTYSYQVLVPWKMSKKKYKVRYLAKYKYKGKIRYKWRYKWVRYWYYRAETRYNQAYALI